MVRDEFRYLFKAKTPVLVLKRAEYSQNTTMRGDIGRLLLGHIMMTGLLFMCLAYTSVAIKNKYGGILKSNRQIGGVLNTQSGRNGVKNSDMERSDMLYLQNRMDIRISLPTKDHSLASRFIEDEKKLLDATWEKGMYKVVNQKDKSYTLMFPPIVVPGVDTLSTSVNVKFTIEDGKIIMRSNDWSIRGKNGAILKDSKFMESFQVEIAGELSIRESMVIKASAVKASDIGVPAPPVVANGWVQYKVEGEKPRALRAAPKVVTEATVGLIRKISQEFATKQFKERFSSSFRSFLTNELSKQAVRKNIEKAKEEAEARKRK